MLLHSKVSEVNRIAWNSNDGALVWKTTQSDHGEKEEGTYHWRRANNYGGRQRAMPSGCAPSILCSRPREPIRGTGLRSKSRQLGGLWARYTAMFTRKAGVVRRQGFVADIVECRGGRGGRGGGRLIRVPRAGRGRRCPVLGFLVFLRRLARIFAAGLELYREEWLEVHNKKHAGTRRAMAGEVRHREYVSIC